MSSDSFDSSELLALAGDVRPIGLGYVNLLAVQQLADGEDLQCELVLLQPTIACYLSSSFQYTG